MAFSLLYLIAICWLQHPAVVSFFLRFPASKRRRCAGFAACYSSRNNAPVKAAKGREAAVLRARGRPEAPFTFCGCQPSDPLGPCTKCVSHCKWQEVVNRREWGGPTVLQLQMLRKDCCIDDWPQLLFVWIIKKIYIYSFFPTLSRLQLQHSFFKWVRAYSGSSMYLQICMVAHWQSVANSSHV